MPLSRSVRPVMKIVIAPDHYKESLSALAVASQLEAGFREIWPDAEYVTIPMTDGGEGTAEAMVAATGGRVVALPVTGPLGQPVEAFYGLTGGCRVLGRRRFQTRWRCLARPATSAAGGCSWSGYCGRFQRRSKGSRAAAESSPGRWRSSITLPKTGSRCIAATTLPCMDCFRRVAPGVSPVRLTSPAR